MTEKVTLREMLKKLMENVFENNPYPFFISIETHCDEESIIKAKEIFKEELHNCLYILPKNYSEAKKYPSPNMLKKKIILTGRISSVIVHEAEELS